MKKRFIIALILLVLFSTYKIQDSLKFRFNHNIKNISVENNSILNDGTITEKLSFLYETNLFFLNKKDIKLKLKEIDFIDSFEVKKIFPNKIKIKVYENIPIAIIQNKTEKKFFTSNGKAIDFIEIEEFSNLPLVFGDHRSFSDFYKVLKKVNFPLNEIKKFYLFESRRWDILTKNNQIIKLPIKDYEISLQNFIDLKDQINFGKYQIFDYRINNQIILK